MKGAVIFSVICGMVFFLFAHVVLWRLRPSNAPRIHLLGGLAGAGLGVSAGVNVLLSGVRLLELFAVLSVHFFLVTLYVFFYAGVARSVSLTLLARIHSADGGAMELRSLLEEYEGSSRFEDRIALMEASDLVHRRESRLSLTAKGATLARLAKVFARLMAARMQG